MTTIIDKGYHVTPEQIEHMAREVGKGVLAGQTYLRCLIVAATESKKRRPLAAIDECHERFYAAVLRGVDGDTRAATFARSAAATLRGYVRSGGKLADIDVAKVTKGTLRSYGAPEEPENRAERSAGRANAALVRAVKRVARKDATLARKLVQAAIEALRAALPARGAAKVPAGTQRTEKMLEHRVQ